jgi:hypothetical protein
MNKIRSDISKTAKSELLSAMFIYGEHHSTHEAYAVLLEEMEEMEEDHARCRGGIEKAWASVRSNDADKLSSTLTLLRNDLLNMTAEGVQCIAMVDKWIRLLNR